MITDKVLENAIHKIQHHFKKEWCGCLTACELLALIKIGFKLTKLCEYKLALAKDQKAKGDMTPRWYYFTMPKKFYREK